MADITTKPSVPLFRCPECGCLHFCVTTEGLVICNSHQLGGDIGCGWEGHPFNADNDSPKIPAGFFERIYKVKYQEIIDHGK